MDFIGRIRGRFLSLLLFTGYCVSEAYGGQMYSPTYVQYVQDVRSTFIKEMQKLGFRCTLTGGGMPYDVRELEIGFMVYQKGSVEAGREKVIFFTEKFLEAINNHEGIRPYLREYPFPISGVCVGVSFHQFNNHTYTDGSVTNAYHAKGKIIYWGNDPNQKDKTIDIFEEPYSEALAHINKAIQVNSAPHVKGRPLNQQVNTTMTPAHKRLGTLATDLAGFGPGRELEALGIKNPEGQKDLAGDIGELIGGVCDLYFGEEFLEQLAHAVALNVTGEYVEHWENGQIRAKVPYKNGYPEGHIHGWYPNGNSAFKGYYKEGKRVGIQLALFPPELEHASDPLGRVLEYDMEGRLHSLQKTLSSLHKLLSWVSYQHGVLDGSVSFYNGKGNGTCFGEWEYRKGKLVKTTIPAKK